jgi:DUF2075 family protein
MLYSRINLSQTNYKLYYSFNILTSPPVDKLQDIYLQYCRYKKFSSVMPIFDDEFVDSKNDVIGYYDNNALVAFSLIKKYNTKNIEAIQFAWDYKNPKLKLGIESLKSECALYKSQGFDFYYLGVANEYKKKIKGFELLGPV